MNSRTAARALGLLIGVVADAVLGDPRRGHPVALYGRVAGAAERRWYRDGRIPGMVFTGCGVGVPVAVGLVAEYGTGSRFWARTAVTAAATWTVLGGTGLAREGAVMQHLLAAGDLAGARARIGHLCGRDPASLDLPDLTRATVESIAENTCDAVVAPLLWGTVAGVPGLLGYRAANTLDAMIGHRTARYERFGWAAARLDDVLNLLPARLTAAALAGAAPLSGGSARTALRVWRRDAGAHPSPNAGPVEAALAGALGLRLGGRNTYQGQVQDRGTLGDGRPPEPADITRTVRACRQAALLSGAGCLAGLALLTVARRTRTC